MYTVQSFEQWLNELRERAFRQYTSVLPRKPTPESERRWAIVQAIDDARKRNLTTWPEIEALKKKIEDIDDEDDARAAAAAGESMASWIAYEETQKGAQGKQAGPEHAGAAPSKGGQPKDETTELGLMLLRKLGTSKKAEILAVVCPLDPEYNSTVGTAQADVADRIWKNILQAKRRDSS